MNLRTDKIQGLQRLTYSKKSNIRWYDFPSKIVRLIAGVNSSQITDIMRLRSTLRQGVGSVFCILCTMVPSLISLVQFLKQEYGVLNG